MAAKTRHKIWAVKIQHCPISSKFDMWVANDHCRQRAPVEIVLSSSGTSQLGMFDIQATTKSKYYDHIVLFYLESRRCCYRSIIFSSPGLWPCELLSWVSVRPSVSFSHLNLLL